MATAPKNARGRGKKAAPAGAAPQGPPSDVLTPAEAAGFLRVPEAAVVQEAEAGRLPGRKIGADWRFSRLALAEWLKAPPAEPRPLSSKERMLSLAGAWKDDPGSLEMVEEIYRERKRNLVGGP
jgi:excisionase family DNA binding protein